MAGLRRPVRGPSLAESSPPYFRRMVATQVGGSNGGCHAADAWGHDRRGTWAVACVVTEARRGEWPERSGRHGEQQWHFLFVFPSQHHRR